MVGPIVQRRQRILVQTDGVRQVVVLPADEQRGHIFGAHLVQHAAQAPHVERRFSDQRGPRDLLAGLGGGTDVVTPHFFVVKNGLAKYKKRGANT